MAVCWAACGSRTRISAKPAPDDSAQDTRSEPPGDVPIDRGASEEPGPTPEDANAEWDAGTDADACLALFHPCTKDTDCCAPNRCLNITGTSECQTEGPSGNGGSIGAGGTLETGGTTGSCSEPVPCDGFDNGPDANLTAAISCLSPSTAPSNAPLRLSIYGHHLAIGPGDYALIVLGSASLLNGVPVTACHLEVQVPANQISPGTVSVMVSPGGWIQASAPVSLTLQ